MKFFALILSIYVLVLTAIPCVDKPEDTTIQKTVICAKTAGSQHQDIDHCSPFCTCNCCSSPKIQQDLVIAFNSFQILIESYSDFSPHFTSCHFAAIWQPPQLG